MSTPSHNAEADREILITRTFAAPRTLVFQAWGSAEHLRRWYAPSGCTLTSCAIDFRAGGSLRLCIRTPDGYECWCRGTYRDVVAPERIVFTLENTDASGAPLAQGANGMDPEWPTLTTVTVTFADLGATTRMTLHQTASEQVAKRTGAYPSWLSMFDRLDHLLAVPRSP
ncbi:MAG TPA: SRPBCC domain-containing protein [Planctomycetota bacterium]|nr:SRPBCC domain-containing protein [Planctomycetota bacterium]